jgi:hypothetical protein
VAPVGGVGALGGGGLGAAGVIPSGFRQAFEMDRRLGVWLWHNELGRSLGLGSVVGHFWRVFLLKGGSRLSLGLVR